MINIQHTEETKHFTHSKREICIKVSGLISLYIYHCSGRMLWNNLHCVHNDTLYLCIRLRLIILLSRTFLQYKGCLKSLFIWSLVICSHSGRTDIIWRRKTEDRKKQFELEFYYKYLNIYQLGNWVYDYEIWFYATVI